MRLWLQTLLPAVFALLAQASFAEEGSAPAQNDPASLKGSTHKSKTVETTVPVYFATDRRKKEAADLVFKEQVTDNLEYLNYGVINEKVKLKHVPADSRFKSCSYSQPSPEDINEAKAVYFPKMPDNSTFDFTKLIDQLKQSGSTDKGLIVHVHGCCMGFTHAAVDAALTSAWLDTPVVLYDWGSPFGGYAGSLQACERSEARFNKFMSDLTKEVPPEKITIVGFSLGNQLIVDFLLQNHDKRKYKDLILTRPDLDLITFQSHLPKLIDKSEQIHLYLARNDFIVHCSGGIRRLVSPWAAADRVGTSKTGFRSYENITVLDVSHVDGLHTIPNAVMSDIYKNNGAIPEKSDHFKYTLAENGIFEVTKLK